MTSTAPVVVQEPHKREPRNEVTSGLSVPSRFKFKRWHFVLATTTIFIVAAVAGLAVSPFIAKAWSFLCSLDTDARTESWTSTQVISISDEMTMAANTTMTSSHIRMTSSDEVATTLAATTGHFPISTTAATTTAQVTTEDPMIAQKLQNCSAVCDGVINGRIADQPVGLAARGTPWRIYPDFAVDGLLVYCDCTDMEAGAWTVFQRRMDGSVDFYRNWANYTDGFGDVMGEFWLGLEAFYNFTTGSRNDVGFDLADWEGNRSTVLYRGLRVKSAAYNYSLISGDYIYSGFGNDMEKHHGDMFSTFDRPNNQIFKPTAQNCAAVYQGAWWYTSSQFCFTSHLNGIYHGKDDNVTDPPLGLVWMAWRGRDYSLKATEIKFRPSP